MKWNELKAGKVYAFGFLVIDVCGSSSKEPADKHQIADFLKGFLKEKAENRGGMMWHWAGDGGICGFLEECEPMVNTAEDVLIELNLERLKRHIIDFSVRICLHFGLAEWDEDPQKISGDEFSWILKNDKSIGVPDAVIITSDGYGLIKTEKLKNKFAPYGECEMEKDDRVIKIYKTYIYDPLSTTKLIDIAKRYYEREERLDQIAPQYDLTEHQIECLLKTAEVKNIVKKQIIVVAPYVDKLEKKVREKFSHLKNVRVIDYRGPYIKEEIAKAAADDAQKLGIKPETSIATSCGTTVMELAKNLETDPRSIKNVEIYPLLITMTAEMDEVSPAGIISFLTRVFPNSRGYAAQFPKLEETNLSEAIKRKETYAKDCDSLIEGAMKAKYMFTGLGKIGGEGVTHSFNRLIKKLKLVNTLKNDLKAVGEFCYQPFTINGELLMDRNELELLRANIIYVDLKKIQEKVEKAKEEKDSVEIIAVAGGKEKHESILGGLRARVFNNLITDIETAEYIVKNI